MNTFAQRYQNDLRGLGWINHFGWLRTAELGQLIWPKDSYARTRADRMARGWIDRQLVIVRPLPDGAGRALVLSARGANLLIEAGIEALSGKDIGETIDGRWQAPATWRHDLISAGVLADLYEKGYDISPERELRRLNGSLVKIPDGLAWNDSGSVLWLETESARKSGASMTALAQTICTISAGGGAIINGRKVSHAMVAFVDGAEDERRYQLDHKNRVSNAILLVARQDVRLAWAKCQLLGCGVGSVAYESPAVIHADGVSRILRTLNTHGWRKNDAGGYVSQYGGKIATIWHDQTMGWSYSIKEDHALCAHTKAQAMRGCAELISEVRGLGRAERLASAGGAVRA